MAQRGAFQERAIALSRSLATALNVHDGDVQGALPDMRLTGNRAFTHEDHEVIRTACWRAERMDRAYACRILRLPLRAPDIVEAVLADRQPAA